MAIIVVNKKTHTPTRDDIYVGRPSILGNPFTMLKEADRAKVCRQYEEWFMPIFKVAGTKINKEMNRLIYLATQQDINLVCWCSPRACHADLIKKIIDDVLQEDRFNPERYLNRVNDST